ncbi:MAG: hypothetical protein PWP46_1765 [Fusobacteriaceae bacterium]|jgi:uncharacterized membrane protein YcjF (UPF0283 family)|nr:hypothetical protein [Fusobacteriaceae bacterium]
MKKILFNSLIPFIIGLFIFWSVSFYNDLDSFAIKIGSKIPHGYSIIWGVYLLIFLSMIYPIIRLFLLQKSLKRPYIYSSPDEKREFYYEYKKRILKEYKKRLKKNHMQEYINRNLIKSLENANSINGIKTALREIEKTTDKKCDKLIKDYAKSVFVSTAISQNGTLDAIFILKLQIELIWKIAHLYNQRPKLKEIINIYISVLANVLAASAFSEISIAELVDSFLKQFISGFPLVSKIGGKITDSVFDGTCNALLSLRVGYLTKEYCKYSSEFDEKLSRKISRENALKAINEIGIKDSISNIFKNNTKE